jgi:hypothetical protein
MAQPQPLLTPTWHLNTDLNPLLDEQAEIERAIFATLAANGMRDGCHIRLTLSRGAKTTSSMNPNFNVFGYNTFEHKPKLQRFRVHIVQTKAP